MLPWQSGLIRAAAVGHLWTGSRQKEAGYQVDGICQLCFEADDARFHRLYLCEACRLSREDVVNPEFLAAVSRTGPGSLLYTRGLLNHPGSLWPSPEGEDAIVYLVDGVQSQEHRSMQGNIY
eukprot:12856409-Heterocapsa_arctica.AAC.1